MTPPKFSLASDSRQFSRRESFGRSPEARRVLVVEASPSTRAAMERVLASEYDVDTAATYEAARDRVADRAYDGVLLSVYHRSREAAIRVGAALQTQKAGYVFGVCGASLGAECSSLVEHGFDDVLQMPFTRDELLSLLARHLDAG
jgi:DNA-binding response OmpR family regulator